MADKKLIKGCLYTVTAKTDTTVSDDAGLNLSVKAGTQVSFVASSSDVSVTGDATVVLTKGNFNLALGGSGSEGGEALDDHIKDTTKHLADGEHDKLTPILVSVTKNGGSIDVDSAITMKNGKNINHGGGASTFVSGNDEFNMSVRGFYGGTKINGTLHKSVELTIDDANNASLKLNDAEVRTKETRVLVNAPSPEVAPGPITATLKDGGDYVIIVSNEAYLNFIGMTLALPQGGAYATARLALVLYYTGIPTMSYEWPANTYWVNQANHDEAPVFDAVSDTPSGYDGTIYHLVFERFGNQLSANVAYKRPFQTSDLPYVP